MKKKVIINKEDYIKIQKKLNREIELERNGGRWIAINRVHESKKAYNRKRNKKINLDDSYSFFFIYNLIFEHLNPLTVISWFIFDIVSFRESFIFNWSWLKSNPFFCLAYSDIVTCLL